MNTILAKLKAEPVRVRLYTLLIVLASYALLKGYVSADDVEFIGTVAALVLGVETTRAKVSPAEPATPKHRA